MTEDQIRNVVEAEPGSLDHQCVELVVEAIRYAFMELHTHYLQEGGDGPHKGLHPGELFMSFVISSIHAMFMSINREDTTERMHMLANELHVMADTSRAYQQQKARDTNHETKH